MRSRQTKSALVVLSLVLMSACASFNQPPPTLSPQAQTAFRNTQAIKVLDLIRDTAIDANAQTPPLVSTATTRKIVEFHESAIKLINATSVGWTSTVYQGLVELSKQIQPAETSLLRNYFNLGISTLKGLL